MVYEHFQEEVLMCWREERAMLCILV